MSYLKKNIIAGVFRVTMAIKGVGGFFDIVIGLLFLFLREETIVNAIISTTHHRIVKNSHLAVSYLDKQASHFSPGTQYFIAFYFLFYGVVNIFLIASLWKGKVWAYPAAIAFFSLFTIYIGVRSFLHRSGLLFFFTLFDIFLVVLIWLEYIRLKKLQKESEMGL